MVWVLPNITPTYFGTLTTSFAPKPIFTCGSCGQKFTGRHGCPVQFTPYRTPGGETDG